MFRGGRNEGTRLEEGGTRIHGQRGEGRGYTVRGGRDEGTQLEEGGTKVYGGTRVRSQREEEGGYKVRNEDPLTPERV